MKRILALVVVALLILTGCTVSTTIQKGLELSHLAFCEQINGDRDFVERQSKTFLPSEVVYVYFEVSGFKSNKSGNSFVYHPEVEVMVKDPNGNTAISRTTVVDQEVSTTAEAPYFYFPVNLTFPENSAEGKYTLTIYVKDAFGDGNITHNEQFYLKRGT
ncbi:MAG: hypothetical protein ACP5GW_02360 [Caldisericaceae bacterium]